MMKRVITIFLIAAMMMTFFIQPVSATYQPELPSIYQTFNDYFMFGSFHGLSNFFGNNADVRNLLQHHYNSWCPANEFKPSSLLNLTSAASAYTTVYNEVSADGIIDEAESELLYAANTTLVLGSTSTQLTFLDRVRALNLTRGPEDQVKVKAHTLFWHNLSQQPEAFFHEGFSNSNPWASKEVMLDRIDSYIQKVFERFAPYTDILYSWDVVNEAIDDFSGFIRNENDYQEGRWGRIFKRPDITDVNARIYEEAAWIRQAFSSAAKYNNQYDLGLTLVYNDFYDADKDYEPKLTSTIEMLRPIYEQMKADGVTFVVGLQNRNATSLSLDVFKDMYNRFSEVCDEFQTTESDTRSDLVANPEYSRDVLPYYLPDGTKNPAWTYSTWQNTPNAKVALVRSGWTAAMANLPEIQREQADWMADQFDFLLENSKGNGGKITVYAFDGVNDSSTFNSNKGAHIFMAADSTGNTNYTAKMSYYAMIGSVARFELKKELIDVPSDDLMSRYTLSSWSRYAAARQTANDILGVRIYDLDGVNNVKSATSELTQSIDGLVDTAASLSQITVNDTPLADFSPGTRQYDYTAAVGPLPMVAATAADATSTVLIAQATELPGKAVITVSSSDGSRQAAYTINFNVDTSLNSLQVDGILVDGFAPDNFLYNMTVPYGSIPQVTTIATDPGASVEISPVTAVPGQTTVEVSAGSAKTTYIINFNVDSSLKSLKVNEVEVSGFSSGTYMYHVSLPGGMMPLVSAQPNDPNAPVSFTQAATVPGQAAVVVGSGSDQLVYTISFSNTTNGNDAFNETTLNTTLWHWVNEDPSTWSLASNPGYMMISPRAGDIYGASTDAKNILLQNAPGDWTIETKIVCSLRPYAPYQQGGIIAYQDMSNYIKLDWEATSSTNTIIQACREVNGSNSANSVNGSVVGSDNTLWLRMVKSGNTYTTYYSTDGTSFNQVGSNYTLNFNNVQAGLIAINGSGTNTDLDMTFDYFHNSANIFVPLPADKLALTALINEAQTLIESDYTPETWTSMQSSLFAAMTERDDPEALQTDVDTACANLQAAIDDLVPRGPAATITGNDSVQAGAVFTLGISLDSLTQGVYAEDLTLSYDPAVFEYDGATEVGVGVSILRDEPSGTGTVRIIAANIGGVTGSSTPILDVGFTVKSGVQDISSTIAVTTAKLGIMPEGSIVQAGLSSKTIAVGAIATVDKSELLAAIAEAQSLHDSAVVGIENGCYLQSDKDTFKAAIDAANTVYGNSSVGQAEVDSATAALNTAKAVFEASVITADTGDINHSSTVDVGDLAIVAYYYGADSTSENWAAAKVADINKDNRVDIEDLAFIASRIAD